MDQPPNESQSQATARGVLGGLAVVLALGGQIWLFSSPSGLGPGLILSGVALLLFVGSTLYPPPPWAAAFAARASLSHTTIMVGVAIALALLTVIVDITWQTLDIANYIPVLILWVSSALAYVAAFAHPAAFQGNGRAWFRAHRAELIGVGLLTLGAAALRFYQLGNIPRVIDGDEGRIGQWLTVLDENPWATPFTLRENFGGLYLQAMGVAVYALGQVPQALRLASAVGGALAIPALYLLGRQLLGARGVCGRRPAGLLSRAHSL